MHPRIGHLLGGIALAVAAMAVRSQQPETLSFGVINLRSVNLTAASWNPILAYVSKKAGVKLALKIGKTAPETTAMTERGEHAFAYTNHLFTPERDKLGYKAILRIKGPAARGVIVVRDDSDICGEKDLDGRVVAFPSHEAFLAYLVPIDYLKNSGIAVKEVFAGNQEGAMAQLQVGQVAAAGLNKALLAEYTRRQDFAYRVIWTSEPYSDIPIMVHPAVPPAVVEAVRRAFLGMAHDAEGRKALAASAHAIQLDRPWSFVAASDSDYDKHRQWYRKTATRAR